MQYVFSSYRLFGTPPKMLFEKTERICRREEESPNKRKRVVMAGGKLRIIGIIGVSERIEFEIAKPFSVAIIDVFILLETGRLHD